MKVHPIFIAVAIAGLTAACDRPGTETTEDTAARTAEQKEQALVRVIHAIPEVPGADVYISDRKEFTGVQFGAVTPYKAVAEKEFKVVLKPAGQDNGPVLMEAKQGIAPGGRYTIVALRDRDGAAKLDIISDDMDNPAAGKTLVRVIHAAPESGSVDVATSAKADDPAIEDVHYGAPARYEEFDTADVQLAVEPRAMDGSASKTKAAAVVEQAQLEQGKAYTLVVAPGEDASKPVQLIKVEDSLPSAPASARQPEPAPAPAQ